MFPVFAFSGSTRTPVCLSVYHDPLTFTTLFLSLDTRHPSIYSPIHGSPSLPNIRPSLHHRVRSLIVAQSIMLNSLTCCTTYFVHICPSLFEEWQTDGYQPHTARMDLFHITYCNAKLIQLFPFSSIITCASLPCRPVCGSSLQQAQGTIDIDNDLPSIIDFLSRLHCIIAAFRLFTDNFSTSSTFFRTRSGFGHSDFGRHAATELESLLLRPVLISDRGCGVRCACVLAMVHGACCCSRWFPCFSWRFLGWASSHRHLQLAAEAHKLLLPIASRRPGLG